MIRIEDADRVRLLTLDRPEALNAMNQALYDATTEALMAAADDPAVAVVVLTGTGRAFCAGQDLLEMAMAGSPDYPPAKHGFPGLLATLLDFPKPLLCAVNGLGLGIGATLLAYADLVFMAEGARLKCPFTSLGVAPEAASSYLFPLLLGRQHASWMLLSSEWMTADECLASGLVWKVCSPDDLLPTTMSYAKHLAAKPISSLIETKRAMTAPIRDQVVAARSREDQAFQRLLGGPANTEALKAFADKREPDFTNLPAGW